MTDTKREESGALQAGSRVFADAAQVQADRMRYTKNTFSQMLVILAIVFDVLYFVSLYRQDVGSYYYTWKIGVSIIYNLIFLLAAFLASEEVKNRAPGVRVSIMLLVLGVVQFLRIFWLPSQAHAALTNAGAEQVAVMSTGTFVFEAACLAISGVCCIAAAVTSYSQNRKLADYMRTLDATVR